MAQRHKWTEREDKLLKKAVEEGQDWNQVRLYFQKRGYKKTIKQCRERWIHYVDPQLTKKTWTDEDTRKMFDHIGDVGFHWKTISERMPGRSYNLIKNRFFAIVRKGLRKACKAARIGKNTEIISQIKPKAILQVFPQKIAFCAVKTSPVFPFTSPVSVKDFILYFAYQKHSDIMFDTQPQLVEVVKKCLEILKTLE